MQNIQIRQEVNKLGDQQLAFDKSTYYQQIKLVKI